MPPVRPTAASISSSGRAASSYRCTRPIPPRPLTSSRSRTGAGDRGMHALIQVVLLGVLTGGVYALMASGQTLIFGIMRVVNLAQGALVIIAAYLTYSLFTRLGIDPFLSVLLTTPLLFAAGAGIQYAFLRRL